MTDFHFPDDEPTAPNVIPLPVTPKPEAPRRESRFAAVYQALEDALLDLRLTLPLAELVLAGEECAYGALGSLEESIESALEEMALEDAS
jgi:hypothetical protein